jgi:hypothetical protein
MAETNPKINRKSGYIMDENKLKAIIDSEIWSSLGYIQSETTGERQQSMEYYLRRPYGNEVEGKSSIVTGEVAEAIDGALPQLIRVFTSSDNIVEFTPMHEGDQDLADGATTYVNHVFYKDNDGFHVLHNWFKDALLEKVGVVKVYWDDETNITKEEYKGLTDDEMTLILQDQEIELVSHDTIELPMYDAAGSPIIDPQTQQQAIDRTHDIKVRKTVRNGTVKVENVPPEEFIISKRARNIQESGFCAHRKMLTRSEMIAMGFDPIIVEGLSTADALEYSPERIARYTRGEQPTDMMSQDHSMQLVEVYECYIKVDYNDDGVAELRRIVYASNTILSDEDCDYIPFHSICPLPIPHKFFGNSLADRTMDLQLIKSTVIRQMLDNLYLTNNSRVAAVDGQVNMDDLLTSTAGGVIRVKNANAIMPLNVTSSASQSFPMLEYLDQVQAKRTGVSDAQQGLDPNILQNVTATAVSAMSNAANGKLELIARIFAETGVKSLFQSIFRLLCKYQKQSRTLMINKKPMVFNPREWSEQYSININVGLGTGSRQEQLATMQMVLQKQEQILQGYGMSNPLVSLKQYRDTLAKFIHMAGFKDASGFINDITPEQMQQLSQPQQPPVDPNTQAAQMLAQVEREKAQLQAQTEMAKLELQKQQMAVDNARKELELQQQAIKNAAEIANQQQKLQVEAAKIKSNNEINRSKATVDAAAKIHAMRYGN